MYKINDSIPDTETDVDLKDGSSNGGSRAKYVFKILIVIALLVLIFWKLGFLIGD